MVNKNLIINNIKIIFKIIRLWEMFKAIKICFNYKRSKDMIHLVLLSLKTYWNKHINLNLKRNKESENKINKELQILWWKSLQKKYKII